jgi:N-glycosylase/DNA lyase
MTDCACHRGTPIADPDVAIMSGVTWGRSDMLFTPAYWALQAHHFVGSNDSLCGLRRLGKSIHEEIAACILGGYGMPAELGLAAFYHLRDLGLLTLVPPAPDANVLQQALSEPLYVLGRRMQYRFAYQRSRYLSMAMGSLMNDGVPESNGRCFRNWLLRLPGIGPKTASWITRNWWGSDEVAILDIHIYRAGVIAGFFRQTESVSRDYFSMEERFLKFAEHIGVRPSVLDAVMWQHMRQAGWLARKLFKAVCYSRKSSELG